MRDGRVRQNNTGRRAGIGIARPLVPWCNALVNSDDHSRLIIPLPDASLAIARPEGGRKLAETMAEALAVAREPLHKIGEYEWCDPDYRQILLWAEALELEPEEVIRRLLTISSLVYHEDGKKRMHTRTTFEGGRIRKLNWDLSVLPLTAFTWAEGLEIEYLRVTGLGISRNREKASIPALHLDLPKLEVLDCQNIGIQELDLSRVRALTILICRSNQLAELDLSGVPKLEALDCNCNHLTDLDLSRVPQLDSLECENNQLTVLNFSHVPSLKYLWCGKNPISKLDLSDTPRLTKLACDESTFTTLDLSHSSVLIELFWGNSRLTELDLSHMPLLEKLACDGNALTSLDLSAVPMLKTIWCNDNKLTNLDLSQLPKLRRLNCENNALTSLDLSHVPELGGLGCARNQISELDFSSVRDLKFLDCSDNPIDSLDLSDFCLTELTCDRRLLDVLDESTLKALQEVEYEGAKARLTRTPEDEY